MTNHFLKYLLFVPGLIVILSQTTCVNKNSQNEDDKLLARVQNRTLYLSELEGMVPPNLPKEDSILLINSFIERWAREAVLLQEAELNLPKDLNIDKLVRDYRSSLIKSNYEQILVAQFLDSLVSRTELDNFYQSHKEQLLLDEPIVRYYSMKVPISAPELNQAEKWWDNFDKDENRIALENYAINYARDFQMKDSVWMGISKLSLEFPPGLLNATNLKNKRSFVEEDNSFRYFFKKEEVLEPNEEPPMSFVEPKIKRLILHQRKQKLLEKKKEEMYQRELRQNNVEIFR
jgi:hypothetical protein